MDIGTFRHGLAIAARSRTRPRRSSSGPVRSAFQSARTRPTSRWCLTTRSSTCSTRTNGQRRRSPREFARPCYYDCSRYACELGAACGAPVRHGRSGAMNVAGRRSGLPVRFATVEVGQVGRKDVGRAMRAVLARSLSDAGRRSRRMGRRVACVNLARRSRQASCSGCRCNGEVLVPPACECPCPSAPDPVDSDEIGRAGGRRAGWPRCSRRACHARRYPRRPQTGFPHSVVLIAACRDVREPTDIRLERGESPSSPAAAPSTSRPSRCGCVATSAHEIVRRAANPVAQHEAADFAMQCVDDFLDAAGHGLESDAGAQPWLVNSRLAYETLLLRTKRVNSAIVRGRSPAD